MKRLLVFSDWNREGKSIYETPEGVELSKHDFHAGSTFQGNIHLDKWQEKELKETMEKGYQPVFWVSL